MDPGACRIVPVSSSGFIGFCTHRELATADGSVIPLVTDHMETVRQRLERKGILFEEGVQHHERLDITRAPLRDPDGYLVEDPRFDDRCGPPKT